MSDATFKQLHDTEKGTALATVEMGPLVGLILRGPAALCAYIGIPEDGHPFVGMDYNDLDLDVHGGLTYSDRGDGHWRPEGRYWFGWDYAHWQDLAFYDLDYPELRRPNGHGWTVPEVLNELRQAMTDFLPMYENARPPTQEIP